jgi:hypothetical protein
VSSDVPEAEVRLEIARRVARDERAQLYGDGKNQRIGSVSIQQAVRDDVAFFVHARPDVFIADFDAPGCAAAAERLSHELHLSGFEPVVCDSGGVTKGEPRRHVFTIMAKPRDHERWRARAKELGSDQHVTSSIRPPGAKHQIGDSRSRPVLPGSLDEVRRRLCEPRLGAAVDQDTLRLIRSDTTTSKDRSNVLSRVVSRLLHRGWTGEEVLSLLQNPAYGISATYQAKRVGRSDETGDGYFWKRLWGWAERTAVVRQGKVDHRLRRYRTHAWDVIYQGDKRPSRATDMAVLEAVIRVCERTGKTRVDVSMREVLLTAQVASLDTVRKALGRLAERGLISQIDLGERPTMRRAAARMANTYDVHVDLVPGTYVRETMPLPWFGHESFRDRTGLGKWSQAVYQLVWDGTRITEYSIAEKLNISSAFVHSTLCRLEAVGMVVKTGVSWTIGDVTPYEGQFPEAHEAAKRDRDLVASDRSKELRADHESVSQ